MLSFNRFIGLLLLSTGLVSTAAAQSQEQPIFTYDYCVKVHTGKGRDFADRLRDVTAPIAQARIDDGTLAAFFAARAILPSGEAARCDYHLLFSFVGWPPEGSREQTEAAMKKAGLSVTYDEMLARRNADSYLVRADLWRSRALSGQLTQGSVVRLNYDKIKPGMTGDWLRMETSGWQKMVDSLRVDRPEFAWGVSTLLLPGGDSLEYNAVTFDAFPSWEAFGKGIPVRETWQKAHPQQDLSDFLDRVGDLRDRPYVDVVKLEHVLRRQ
jgi:hypothetical protein